MKDLQLFNFKGQDVRAIWLEDKNDWWYVLADVCKILGLDNPGQVAATRLKKEGIILNDIVDAQGRKQQVLCVNLQNYLRAIMRSNKSEAESFQDWVFEEVLPTIIKTGSYSIQQNRKELSNSEIAANPELALQTLELHKTMRLAFYRSARDWQGLVNILYPEQKKSGKKSNAQPPKIVIYDGEEVAQLMIAFDQDVA